MPEIDDIEFERQYRKAALSVRAFHFEKYRVDFVDGAWIVPGSEHAVPKSERPGPEPIVDRKRRSHVKTSELKKCKDCDEIIPANRQRCVAHAARYGKARNNQKTKDYYYAKMAVKRPCGWRPGCENPIAFRSRMCRDCITFRRLAEKAVASQGLLAYNTDVAGLANQQL